MQFLSVIPEQVESAAQDLAGIRSALSASYAAAAGPTTAVVSAAEDEVSTAIASIFGAYGRQCQVLSAQASAFHDEFVNLLKTGATAYRNTEFANAQSNVLNAVNAPARSLLGHPSAAESVQNSAPTLGGGHSTVTAGLAAQAGRAVATVEQQAAAAVAPLPSAGAGLAQVVNGVVTAGQGSAAKLATALQSAAPWLAKSGGEFIVAGQSALTGVALLQPAVVGVVQAGGTFLTAGTSAATGLGLLTLAGVEFSQGVGNLALSFRDRRDRTWSAGQCRCATVQACLFTGCAHRVGWSWLARDRSSSACARRPTPVVGCAERCCRDRCTADRRCPVCPGC